ncbi:serine hydrolase [Lyngbya confervoides]|uniref:Class A beta-lactamase-related serine hydrolase n=1 Tax=Lyngbya confervoides BDU141951 TaxID=1574623 RepID=A0ABD4SY26_9CYAN|nr:serine hydrolase [Lyngbya confervoides]MCM1981254.1 class A beta-lactamase-related serine hydrolase [Lyngbya confervoides BDU141951]
MTFFSTDNAYSQHLPVILASVWAEFPWLARNQLAVTGLIYDPPYPVNTGGALAQDDFWRLPIQGFSYRGVEPLYPASVVKLFYLVACHEWLERGMLPACAETDRALRDMIMDSSNDATGYVLDVLTGTTSGPSLPPDPFATWKHQRNIVNRYFQSLGWVEMESINVNQKTWGEGPYGRENDFVGVQRENRNKLTTEATARLMHSIVGGVAVTAERSQAMMNLMKRSLDRDQLRADPENQVMGFIGEGLALESQVWSKAGWTSQVRHDCAYAEVPGKAPFLLVVFTEGKTASQNEDLIPFLTTQVVQMLPEQQFQ